MWVAVTPPGDCPVPPCRPAVVASVRFRRGGRPWTETAGSPRARCRPRDPQRDRRAERVCPLGTQGCSGGGGQDLVCGVGAEAGHLGDGFEQRARVRPVGVQLQGGRARPGLEHGGRRIGTGEERGGFAQGGVEAGPGNRYVDGTAVGAQDLADGASQGSVGWVASIMSRARWSSPCSIRDMILIWRPSRSRLPMPRCLAVASAVSVHLPTRARARAPSTSRVTHRARNAPVSEAREASAGEADRFQQQLDQTGTSNMSSRPSSSSHCSPTSTKPNPEIVARDAALSGLIVTRTVPTRVSATARCTNAVRIALA